MGRGNAALPEDPVAPAKIDELISAYETLYGAGSIQNMTALRMLGVIFKNRDYVYR
jgi:hypothetical protein